MIHLSNKFSPKIPVLLNYQLLNEDHTRANPSGSAVKRLPTSLETEGGWCEIRRHTSRHL
jgi:hypothetical protein